MDYMRNGCLSDFLREVKNGEHSDIFDNTMRTKLICGIVIGMMALHDHNIIHRDLKPSNILLNDHYEAVICDLGLSYSRDFDSSDSGHPGNYCYMAPELMRGPDGSSDKCALFFDERVDVFSFTLVLYELLFGDSIYYAKEYLGPVFCDCTRGIRPSLASAHGYINEAVLKLIESGWSVNRDDRPASFHDIFDILRSIDFRIFDDVRVQEVHDYIVRVDCHACLC